MKKQEYFAKQLRNNGFRATPSRIDLLALLSKCTKPITIKDIQQKLNMDHVTLYRALEAFVQKGIVRQIDFRHGHAHYELVSQSEDHHHIICTVCKRIEDFKGCSISNITKTILNTSKTFISINDHTLELYGVCVACKG